MLIVTQVSPYRDGPAGVHGVLGQAATALSELAEAASLGTAVVDDVRGLAPGRLEETAVLALFNIGETPWSAGQRSAVEQAVRSGTLGVLGLHSATDACRDWEGYGDLLGARFAGHPWTCGFDVEVIDAAHPATAALPTPWAWNDEVYLFDRLRPDAHVLLRVDPRQLDQSVPGARVPPHGLPVAWCHRYGAGRVFYCALGHFPAAWESPVFLRFLAGALDWVIAGAATEEAASPDRA